MIIAGVLRVKTNCVLLRKLGNVGGKILVHGIFLIIIHKRNNRFDVNIMLIFSSQLTIFIKLTIISFNLQ